MWSLYLQAGRWISTETHGSLVNDRQYSGGFRGGSRVWTEPPFQAKSN